jgi:hypothetical protein
MFEGEWRTPAEVAEIVATDKRWQDYRELRDASTGSVRDHEALAKWCLRQGLAAEERYHWCNVLLASPTHKQARQRLGFREYRGGLFTEEQIEQHRRQVKEAEANMRRYKPRFIELCRRVHSESSAVRQAALAQIRGLTDPGAIEALRAAIARDKRHAGESGSELHQAVVAALANMPEHGATLYLLNYSLFSESESVRTAAAEALRARKSTDYVPLLMAALKAPIEAEFDVVTAADGTVRMMETLHQTGPEGDAAHVQDTNFEVAGVLEGDRRINPNAVLGRHLSQARQRAAATKQRVDAYNDAVAQRNARIQETLKIATGMDLGSEPEKYWQAWGDENELHYGDEKPVYQTYEEETYTYYYEPSPTPVVYPVATTPVVTRATGSYSCFAPGTPVWTQAGPTPIERIAVGDIVLAQHPTTGELAYRPVLATTVGAPVAVLRLTFAGESIVATPGHRFWVNGSGWQMAKALKPAMKLHAVNAAEEVAAIEKGEDVACHNLVVDEFHTFFVGKSMLLVHDKSCPQPTTALIPGMVRPRKTPLDALATSQIAP